MGHHCNRTMIRNSDHKDPGSPHENGREESLLSQTDGPHYLDPLKGFSEKVFHAPHAIAAIFQDEHITYQELHRRAIQLGHRLQDQGIGPETIVGICLDRSFTQILSILGVIKAGGCLLLLEPSYPRNRLMAMVENSKPALIVTEPSYLRNFQDYDIPAITLNPLESDSRLKGGIHLRNVVGAGNLSSILYTSGSTGKPKGVMETYQEAAADSDPTCQVNSDETQNLKFVSHDRVLVKCPISFAPFLWELLAPLQIGATVVLAKKGGEQDFFYLAELITNEQITVGHFVPSSLRILLDQPNLANCQSLTAVCCSGENLPDTLRELFFSRLNADIYLTYAATEAPGATWVHLHRGNFRKPLRLNQEKTRTMLVLDSEGNQVSNPGTGEIFVEASKRIRGYFSQPALTAEKFVPDPFSVTPGARLYRTGDLANVLSSEHLKVIGRKDQQVKIRGFRIELGEIETSLRQHPQVQDAAVLSHQASLEDHRLVAYILPSAKEPPEAAPLKHYLQTQLPEYMVPSLFMVLETFPLTPNGKVDKRALPAPNLEAHFTRVPYVAPRDVLEEYLVEVYQEVLKTERIGIHDNFFELGGHSLLAIQMLSRLRDELNLDLSLRALFEHSTIERLAKEIEKRVDIPAPGDHEDHAT